VWLLALFSLLLLLFTLLVQGGAFMAWRKSVAVSGMYVNSRLAEENLRKIDENMRRAMFWDPLNGFYCYKRGTAEWYLDREDKAFDHHFSAVRRDPLEGLFLQQLGLLVGEESGKLLIEEGYKRALDKEGLAFTYAEWLLWQGRREEAKAVLADRFSQDNNEIKDWMVLLDSYSFSRKDIAEILPVTTRGWIRYGRYSEENGNDSDSVYFFDHAVELLLDMENPRPSLFREIIEFYSRQGLVEKRLAVLRLAVQKVPDSACFHILLGEYYRDRGISYRAKEEFERALILEPANERARRQLRRMGYGDAY
jgi:tetratricopeptide (TPR) repeat protein